MDDNPPGTSRGGKSGQQSSTSWADVTRRGRAASAARSHGIHAPQAVPSSSQSVKDGTRSKAVRATNALRKNRTDQAPSPPRGAPKPATPPFTKKTKTMSTPAPIQGVEALPPCPYYTSREATLHLTMPPKAAKAFAGAHPNLKTFGPVEVINGLHMVIVELPQLNSSAVSDIYALVDGTLDLSKETMTDDGDVEVVDPESDSSASGPDDSPMTCAPFMCLSNLKGTIEGRRVSPEVTEYVNIMAAVEAEMKQRFMLVTVDHGAASAGNLPGGWPFPSLLDGTPRGATMRLRAPRGAPSNWIFRVFQATGHDIAAWGLVSRKAQTHLRIELREDADVGVVLDKISGCGGVEAAVENYGAAAVVTIQSTCGPTTDPNKLAAAVHAVRKAFGPRIRWEDDATSNPMVGMARGAFRPTAHHWGKFQVDGGVVEVLYQPSQAALGKIRNKVDNLLRMPLDQMRNAYLAAGLDGSTAAKLGECHIRHRARCRAGARSPCPDGP